MELDFEIVYRAGAKHQLADVLSRLPTNVLHRTMLEDGISFLAVT